MIKLTRGGRYVPVSKSGRRFGPATTKKKAEKRIREVEYFKHKKKR